MRPKTITIDGKTYPWRELLALRREQIAAAREISQPPLFEMVEDRRPKTQRKAAGRYEEPTLF